MGAAGGGGGDAGGGSTGETGASTSSVVSARCGGVVDEALVPSTAKPCTTTLTAKQP
jgi:hypothetical protein